MDPLGLNNIATVDIPAAEAAGNRLMDRLFSALGAVLVAAGQALLGQASIPK